MEIIWGESPRMATMNRKTKRWQASHQRCGQSGMQVASCHSLWRSKEDAFVQSWTSSALPFPYTAEEVERLSKALPKQFDWRVYGAITPKPLGSNERATLLEEQITVGGGKSPRVATTNYDEALAGLELTSYRWMQVVSCHSLWCSKGETFAQRWTSFG
ncbi:hypothetical protein MSG28_013941 [Choristoneura fumiferana]|uniref:Uncharacterized protein n=1 Tax=Choristoneura fumiferana TaxID=7141 RepID=A0ACC0K9E7_CHOFU|nr:hypothetical protein MSG28_013941 [Choristoneura fumiferana]